MSNTKRCPTRMHEVLGVEANEDFIVSFPGDGEYQQADFECFVDDGGNFKYKKHPELPPSIHIINYAINHGITRRPRLTEGQEYVLKALYVAFDFKWVAKQEDGQVMAFEDKPQKHKDYFSGETQWYCGEGEEEKDYGWKVKPSSPISGLVSWSDPAPLDIVQVLRENGVEVE